jgi:hypothetical protein
MIGGIFLTDAQERSFKQFFPENFQLLFSPHQPVNFLPYYFVVNSLVVDNDIVDNWVSTVCLSTNFLSTGEVSTTIPGTFSVY